MKIKRLLCVVIFLHVSLFYSTLFSQSPGVSISPDGTEPHESAGLDVNFDNKGFLPPRVELIETSSFLPLTSHVEGMVVYNIATINDVTPGLYTNDGDKWVALTPIIYTAGEGVEISNNEISVSSGGGVSNNFFLGQDTLGGIVFYIFYNENGTQEGLIVSKTETIAQWQSVESITNANSTWDGAYNMNLMYNSPAKDWVVNNFSEEWYLPSMDELNLLWANRFHVNSSLSNIPDANLISNVRYWSSTERTDERAFSFGSQAIAGVVYGSAFKTSNGRVRAIRKF